MRPLTILNIAYPLAPVGIDAVGGSEQVLSSLDHALAATGHRSIVIACQGSQVAGELHAFAAPPRDGPITNAMHTARQDTIREITAEVLRRERVDVIHMHGLDFYSYLPAPGPPVLATLHLPLDWYPPEALAPDREETWVNGVSESQMRDAPPGPRLLPPIANGVPVARLGAVQPRKGRFALTLARVCPEKGLHLALDAARAAKAPMLLAGEVFPYPAHQSYFHGEILPRLNRQCRYLGPVGFARKRRLVAAALCLLVPSLVAETSSLVAMEAAACGTPVIAFRNGALPEVVEDGRTGFLVDDVDGMAEAIRRVDRINPATCRETARRRFSTGRMAAAYIDRYRMLTRVADPA